MKLGTPMGGLEWAPSITSSGLPQKACMSEAQSPVKRRDQTYEFILSSIDHLLFFKAYLIGRPIRVKVLDCYIDICSPEVLIIFTDNFDYQHLWCHFVKGLLVDDCLYEPFEEEAGYFQFATAITSNDIDEIQKFLNAAVDASCEGFIIKTLNKDATYEPSKLSLNWLELTIALSHKARSSQLYDNLSMLKSSGRVLLYKSIVVHGTMRAIVVHQEAFGVARVVAAMIGLSIILLLGVLDWDDCLSEILA
ncbi:hypothetical protein FEM48_Zijuj09G0039500 [Ziziphus jujuba var. spinosa]|uniref:ATP-dependent DNA ligase family profile domain-containing protein n=1 Tax=Ziziphus jujuba var. spinosa TaxID=714518 RepID=A0A978UQR9_ZIZJJ|nr:hypothetical protein FEM48_Zijuj09G0039500 [Ziziphus jujuba var. spinosa]